MMKDKILCEVIKSLKHEGMYLYIDKQKGLDEVPEALLERFGQRQSAMTMLLDKDRPLARADAGKVMASIQERGFYLQLPPEPDAYMQEIRHQNSKL